MTKPEPIIETHTDNTGDICYDLAGMFISRSQVFGWSGSSREVYMREFFLGAINALRIVRNDEWKVIQDFARFGGGFSYYRLLTYYKEEKTK